MSCFPCFSSQRSKSLSLNEPPVAHAVGPRDASSPAGNGNPNSSSEGNGTESNSKTFTFRELAAATKNFRQECLLGEGGYGRVYKGTFQATGQVVAVKQLDRNGMQGNKDFLVEVTMLSLLHHPNLVNLIGYCADGDQRLLVYEYLPFGSLDDHLLDLSDGKKPLDWPSRMKIASGAAQGLEYLHEKANPPIIYRNLKSSNILLDEEYNPRLSNYGLAKLGLDGGTTHVTPRVMGTYGYSAPEYERTGELTLKSDVYSFGVILLELLTGRRAVDTSRPTDEQNLVSWAQPYFRDPKRFPELADLNLNSRFPVKSLNQAVGVCAMCLQEEPAVRPLIGDVVATLSFLTMGNEEIPSPKAAPTHDNSERKSASDGGSRRSDSSGEEEEDSDEEDEESSDSDDDEGQCADYNNNNNQEETNPEKPPEKVKKSVKWASRCRSKGGNGGSVNSRSSDNDEGKADKNAASGQNLVSKSSVKLHSNSIQYKDAAGTSKGDDISSKKLSQVGSSSANSNSSSSGSESTEGSFMTQDSMPKSNGTKVESRDESSDSSSSESDDEDYDDESSQGRSFGRSSRSSSYKYQGSSLVSRRNSSKGSYGDSASFDTTSDSSSSDSEPEDQNGGQGQDQMRRCRTTSKGSSGAHSKKKVGLSSKSTNYTDSEDIRNVDKGSWKGKDRDS